MAKSAKHWRESDAVLIDEFKEFYRKDGLLWVPFLSGSRNLALYLTPETTIQGIGYAIKALALPNVVPMVRKAWERGEKRAAH